MSTPADHLEETIPPEDLPSFRLGQLLIVLTAIGRPWSIERLAYADFFSANPMLISELDEADRTELVLAGFDSRTIEAHSPAQRFATRRERIRSDLATLIAYGLVRISTSKGSIEYELTEKGEASGADLEARYADGLRTSTALVLPVVRKLSDRKLRASAQVWLNTDEHTLDLMGLDLRTNVESI